MCQGHPSKGTSMTKDEALRTALKQAYNLGQIYWQQADSEYMSQHRKADLTEAKFKELVEATVAALEAKDEPVAWMFQHEETGRTMCVDAQQLEWGFEKGNPRLKKIAPLYTTPPQRTWVGLTDKDWKRSKHTEDFQKGVDWAEGMLEAKNT